METNQNLAFIRSLAGAIVLLILSAGILIIGFMQYFPQTEFHIKQNQQASPTSITVKADNLKLILGQGKHIGHTLTLQQLTGTDKRYVISAGRVSLKSRNYPFLQYTVNNLHPGLDLFFFWRSRDNPQQISTAKLYWSGDGPTYFNLNKETEWQREIIEIGLLIYGDLRSEPLKIIDLELHPYSANKLLATIWSEWIAFEGWSQKSINFLRGTAPKSILSPTLAVGAWSGLAILLYGAWRLTTAIKVHKTPKIGIIVPVTIMLIGWIALDIKWQFELFHQLVDTKYLYAGKTTEEKKLAAEDGNLYAYIQHLKKDVLPATPARIFILHDSKGHNYWRLRAQYHLLPHNVYNYGQLPLPKYLRNGDWLLVLGDIKGLSYNQKSQTLNWNKDQRLNIELKDEHPLGKLLLFNLPSLYGNCRSNQTNIVSVAIETNHLFNCATEAPISFQDATFHSDSQSMLSAKQITMLPGTYIEQGATLSATAAESCKHVNCDSGAWQLQTKINDSPNHE